MKIERKYTMMHCSACEERGYTMARDDCLSGGRYCMKSTLFDDMAGEVMLVQVLKNKCTEQVLNELKRPQDIWNYYWTANRSCVTDFIPQCFNTILQKLEIKDRVFKCIKDSFEKTAETNDTSGEPKILLQENKLLRKEKADFSKIEHYSNFPLLKINGMIFYGSLTYKEVMGFVCSHVRDNLNGCSAFNKIVTEKGSNTAFKWFAIIFVIVIFGVIIEVCRRALKHKFEGELSHQIDKSISSFLERTGGTDL